MKGHNWLARVVTSHFKNADAVITQGLTVAAQ